MANKIEKQKRVVVGFGIAMLVISLVACVLGIVLLVSAFKASTKVALALDIVFGVLLLASACVALVAGIRVVWIGGSVKATHGSISEANLGKGDETNTLKKECPKCGCTNTVDASVCTNCGEELK